MKRERKKERKKERKNKKKILHFFQSFYLDVKVRKSMRFHIGIAHAKRKAKNIYIHKEIPENLLQI